jgi:hypothetical protein
VDDPIVIALIVVAAIAVVALVAVAAAKRKRRAELQSRFGPEYDRTIERAGGKRKAEKDLAHRAEERDRLHLRELTPAERDRYRDEWQALQASFVDRPESALADADRLLSALMRDRGYPVDDFDRQADLVSVDHPQVVSHYRKAHTVHERSRREDVSTEDQRQAIVHYRSLFDELMVPGGSHDGDDVIDARDDRARDEDAELTGLESLVVHAASGEVPAEVLRTTRGWSEDEWAGALDALVRRGIVDAAGSSTEAGRALRQEIEDRTDRLAAPPWSALAEDEAGELRDLVRPWSKAVFAAPLR